MIPEPPGTLGLWPRVRALSGWPLTDEDRVRGLAEAWRTGAAHFATAGAFDPAPLAVHWPDPAGVTFHQRVRGEVESALSSSDAMQSLANRSDHLADVVIGVKTAVRTLIEANLDRFAAARNLAPEDRASVEQAFVAQLAGDVNRLLASGAEQIGGAPPPAPAEAPPPAEGTGGLGEFAAAFGNEAASFGNALLNNPGLVAQAGAGVGLGVLSGAGVLAGGALTVAPGGAAAGVPLTGASLVGLGTGLALTGGALAAISESADGADRVTPFGGGEGTAPAPDAEGAATQPGDGTAPPRHWETVDGARPDPNTIHVPPLREIHILDGDGSGGGGHLAGTGKPYKSEFPEAWDEKRVIENVTDVAKNPDVRPELQDNGRWRVSGTRDGVSIDVIVEPDGRIWSAFPTGGEGVTVNDADGNPIPG